MTLPQLHDRPFVTDGGLETTLVFHDGIDLPDFAAFPLLDDEDGRAALTRYFTPYVETARPAGTGIVLDTPTWRANLDWGPRLGYDAEALADVNRRAVAFIADLAGGSPDVPAVLNGVIGPRGDGYVVGTAMTADEAASYHALQARAFSEAGAEMVTAVTMNYADEAIGVARAATAAGIRWSSPSRRRPMAGCRADRLSATRSPRWMPRPMPPSPTTWSTAPIRRTSPACSTVRGPRASGASGPTRRP